jgi:uncharacterized protein YkwD
MIGSRARLSALALALLVGSGLVAAQEKKESEFKLSSEEKTILDLTNKERTKEKVPPLEANAVLCKVARAHAANMAKKGEMKHDLDGKNPAQRVLDAGYDYARVGENIATSDGAPLAEIMQGWMDSKIHRANILKDGFREIGLGVARNGKDVYYVQVFGTRRKAQ